MAYSLILSIFAATIYEFISMQENFHEIYEKLFRTAYPQLFFYAQRLVGEDDAADVVEDVFFELWKRRESIDFGDRIESFLYKAVYTRCINVLRRRNITTGYVTLLEEVHEKQLERIEDVHSAASFTKIENSELGVILQQAISSLPAKCGEVFRLSYLHGMHNDDIAEVLGISLRTVEAHIYHALKTLRKLLKDKTNRGYR